jgi:hypothetical protein
MIFNSTFSYTRELGMYHTVVDLAEAIAKDLRSDICAYIDRELRLDLKNMKGVKYYLSIAV